MISGKQKIKAKIFIHCDMKKIVNLWSFLARFTKKVASTTLPDPTFHLLKVESVMKNHFHFLKVSFSS